VYRWESAVRDHAVATLSFGCVERLIGTPDRVGRIGSVPPRASRSADADRDDAQPRRAPAAPARPPADAVEAAIVAEAEANPTDGYRMVCAWARRRLGRPVNRKRVLRVMRERRLIQRRRPSGRRRRPGFFRVERPDQLWHLDMTSVWVAEHGWVYLMAAIDCCTREIVAWHLETRCRAKEAIGLIERAATERGIPPGTLTLGTDNGSAFTARPFKAILVALGITHRRGGYRDPESQAFIESWFGKLKERCIWREEFETLDQAREVIRGYVEHYHHRPHSRLNYRTPREVAATWNDEGHTHLIPAA